MLDSESTFAGYRLHSLVARDAVSSTYRAVRSTDHGAQTVSLQVSEPLAGIDHARIEAARRKADAVRDIDHPGIARPLDTGEVDDRLYVATAWRESVTLRQLLDQRWRTPARDAVALLELLATGLDAVHAAGIVHGALSTQTIRVSTREGSGDDRAFLTGFGIGDLLALRMGSGRQREQGPALEDLLYVAPEQLRAEPLNPATDQYALACALYHCIAGQPPFVRDTTAALFGAHLFAQPPMAELPPDAASPVVRERLTIGLAKRPQQRHRSCAEMIGTQQVGTVPLSAALRRGERGRAAGAAGSTRALTPNGLRLPVPLLPLLAVLGTVVVAVLAVGVLRDTGDTSAAALTDQPREASAVAPTADGSDPQQPSETQREAEATVGWDTPIAGGPVALLTLAGDVLVVVTEDTVAAVQPGSGEPRWQRDAAGGAVSDAVVVDDVVVYRSAVLRAHGITDGRRRWTRDDELTPTASLTATTDGVLYGTGPGQGLNEVVAIDPASGDELWHFHGDNGRYIGDTTEVAADEDLVVAAEPGLFRALDPSGEQVTTTLGRVESAGSIWQIDGIDAWLRTATLTGDALVLATRNGRICSHARDDGRRRWCARIDGVADRRPIVLADDERVTVATRTAVTTLDATTGDELWDAAMDTRVTAADATADTVIVAEAAGTVRALGADSGEQRWALRDQGRITALRLTDQAAYAGRSDGSVAQLQPPPGE